MSVKLTKWYGCITLIVSAEFVNLETKSFLEDVLFYVMLINFVAFNWLRFFQIGKIKFLRFLTGKGADISVCDKKNNSAVHFAVDIIKLLLGKRRPIKLADRNDENPQPISGEFANLEERNFFLNKEVLFWTRLINMATVH